MSRDWSDAAANQGAPEIDGSHEAGRGKEGLCPGAIRGSAAGPTLDFRLPELWQSTRLSPHSVVRFPGNPRKLTQRPHFALASHTRSRASWGARDHNGAHLLGFQTPWFGPARTPSSSPTPSLSLIQLSAFCPLVFPGSLSPVVSPAAPFAELSIERGLGGWEKDGAQGLPPGASVPPGS